MDYHLKPIDQFIAYYLKPRYALFENMDEAFLNEFQQQLDLEFDKIKIYITESYHTYDQERIGRHFIRNHQRRVIIIINKISSNLMKKVNDWESIKIIEQVLADRLSNLLIFLEDNFVHCIDTQLNITVAYGNKRAMEYSKLLASFDSPFYYSDDLMKIALEPIYAFIKKDKSKYTYIRVKYLDRLASELDRLCATKDFSFKPGLIELMITINFNNKAFLKYLTDHISQDAYGQDDHYSQLERLRWHRKQYKQETSKSDIALLPNRENIKNQIMDWIKEEIKYQESKATVPDQYEEPRIKLQLSLTMDQLAMLIKIAKETGILLNEELRPVTRLVCRHVSTKKQQNISPSSLYNSIFKLEVKDPQKLREDIMKILQPYLY